MLKAASRILVALAGALILFAARAEAAMVSGVYTSPTGKPLAAHQLHFENRISGDIYLTHTGDDGSSPATCRPEPTICAPSADWWSGRVSGSMVPKNKTSAA